MLVMIAMLKTPHFVLEISKIKMLGRFVICKTFLYFSISHSLSPMGTPEFPETALPSLFWLWKWHSQTYLQILSKTIKL